MDLLASLPGGACPKIHPCGVSMSTTTTNVKDTGMLASLLNDDVYHPPEPKSLEENGVSPVIIETLVMKLLVQVGSSSGRDIAKRLCL